MGVGGIMFKSARFKVRAAALLIISILFLYQNCGEFTSSPLNNTSQLNESNVPIEEPLEEIAGYTGTIRTGILGVDESGNLLGWAFDEKDLSKSVRLGFRLAGALDLQEIVCDQNNNYVSELFQTSGSNSGCRIELTDEQKSEGIKEFEIVDLESKKIIASISIDPSDANEVVDPNLVSGTQDSSSGSAIFSEKENVSMENNGTPGQGTNRDEVLRGTSEADQIFAFGGDDDISGKEGNDTIYPGLGDDNIYPGEGQDQIIIERTADDPKDFDILFQGVDGDQVLCQNEKASQCIDNSGQRILLFPSGSTLSIQQSFRNQTDISDCIQTSCSTIEELYPGLTAANHQEWHVGGGPENNLIYPKAYRDQILIGRGGNDTYVFQRRGGHHIIRDRAGQNTIICLNFRVKVQTVDDGIRLDWGVGSVTFQGDTVPTMNYDSCEREN